MLRKLTDYLREREILSTHFRCEHGLSCAECVKHPKRPDDWRTDVRFAMEDSGDGDTRPCPKCGTPMNRAWDRKKKCEGCGYCPKFTGPNSSLVGAEYERSAGFARGGLPRLLFLSPDSGGGHWNAKPKTPDRVRRWEEGEGPNVANYSKGDQRKHWYRTYELAWYVLRAFKPKKFEKIENVTGHFAHVNAAKCSVNYDANRQAPRRLIRNCREYLLGELDILRPEIVITQGTWCRYVAIQPLYRSRIDRIEGELAWVRMNDAHKFLWLWTYHPTSWRRGGVSPFEKQADYDASGTAQGWVRRSRRIRQLLEESQSGQVATNRMS